MVDLPRHYARVAGLPARHSSGRSLAHHQRSWAEEAGGGSLEDSNADRFAAVTSSDGTMNVTGAIMAFLLPSFRLEYGDAPGYYRGRYIAL